MNEWENTPVEQVKNDNGEGRVSFPFSSVPWGKSAEPIAKEDTE